MAAPACDVPSGCVQTILGAAFSEPTLIKLASGYEAFTQIRANNLPTFNETVPFNNIQGTTLNKPPRRASPASKDKRRMQRHL